MNLFGWRKNLTISDQNPTFKVRYLGNVQTSVMKGEGCVDRATNIIWSNHQRNDQPGIDMKIELTGSGMKAYTKDQGLTEYLASRISYCIAHKEFPRLFIWVYRHEGRKSKMELRCHAVLCKNEAKAKAIAFQLCQKLKDALDEFKREKLHLQNSRLVLQKTNSVPKSGSILPLRTQLLSTAKNFRPPPPRSNSAAKLGAILEDQEDDCVIEEEEGEEEEESRGESQMELRGRIPTLEVVSSSVHGHHSPMPSSPSSSAGPCPNGLVHKGREHHDILEALDLGAGQGSYGQAEEEGDMFGSDDVIDLEFGNDFDEFELHQNGVDSDEESAESGFHDQEASFPDSELSEGMGGGESDKKGVKGKKESVDKEEEEEEVCTHPEGNDNSRIIENTAL